MSPRTLLPLFLLVLTIAGAYFLSQSNTTKETDGGGEPEIEALEGSSDGDLDPANLVDSGTDLVSEPKADAGRASVPQAEEASPEVVAQKAAHTIRGRVVDANGAPLEGVGVQLDWRTTMGIVSQGDPDALVSRVETDPLGEFEMTVANPSRYSLRLAKGGYLPRQEAVEVLESPVTHLEDFAMEFAMVLEGRVLDERGAGIAGVTLFQPMDSGQGVVIMDDGAMSLGQTDADGSFRLDTLAPGPWRILAQHDGFRDRVFTGELPAGMRASGLMWTLPDGLALRGRVANLPADAPENMVVKADLQGGYQQADALGGSTENLFLRPSQANLQADGTFELVGLHPEKSYRLGLYEETEATSFWLDPNTMLTDPVTVPSNAGQVELVWAPKASLRLQVVNADTNEPVTSYRLHPSDWELLGALGDAQPVERPKGLAEIEGLPASQSGFDLTIQAEGYDEHVVSQVRLRKGQVTDLGVIALQPAQLCQILVVEAATGEPIKRASVRISKAGQGAMGDFAFAMDSGGGGLMGTRSFRERTDKDGLASLQYYAGEPCSLSVKRRGFAEFKIEDVVLDGHATTPYVVKLSEGGQVLATVVDAEGEPVAGFPVTCEPVKAAPAGNQTTERRVMVATMGPGMGSGGPKTNAQGQVSFKNLAPGDYECVVKVPGESPMDELTIVMEDGNEVDPSAGEGTRVTVLEGETVEVRLYAPTLATIEGIIREDGVPLVGARVSIGTDGSMGLSMFGGGPSDRTDAKGFYQLKDVKPGTKNLIIEHAQRVMPVEFEETIVEGLNQISKDLVVTVIAGRVTDESGTPLPGLTVRAEEARDEMQRELNLSMSITSDGEDTSSSVMVMGDGPQPIVTDEEGRFRLRGVQAGVPLQVVATGDDWQETRSRRMTLPEGSLREGIHLKASPAGKLRVTVLDDAGEPIPHAVVQASRVVPDDDGEPQPSGAPQVTVTNSKGVASITGLTPGKVRVEVSQILSMGMVSGEDSEGEPELPEPKEVVVERGKTAEVTLQQ